MMISAFSVSCGYFSRIREGRISMNDFYSKRYKRVLPFFALLIVIDVIQTLISEGPVLNGTMKSELYEAYTDMTLVFGLLPDARIEVVGVGWFLGVIFLFYMLYPFFTFLLHTRHRAWLCFAISIGLWGAVYYYFSPARGVISGNTNMLICAPYFMAGGLIYLYRQDITAFCVRKCAGVSVRTMFACLTLAYTALFFIFPSGRIHLFSNLLLYSLWLVYAVAESSSESRSTLFRNRIMGFLSSVSMEIYLCHMMFFRVAEKLYIERFVENNDISYWTVCIFVLAGSMCFALVWKQIEKKLVRS